MKGWYQSMIAQSAALKELSRQETPNSGGWAKGDETSGGDDDEDTEMKAQKSRHMRAHESTHMRAHI